MAGVDGITSAPVELQTQFCMDKALATVHSEAQHTESRLSMVWRNLRRRLSSQVLRRATAQLPTS